MAAYAPGPAGPSRPENPALLVQASSLAVPKPRSPVPRGSLGSGLHGEQGGQASRLVSIPNTATPPRVSYTLSHDISRHRNTLLLLRKSLSPRLPATLSCHK